VSGFRIKGDAPTTGFDDAVNDRETEPGTSDRARVGATEEWLERVASVIDAHSYAVVGHADRVVVGFRVSGDLDLGGDIGAAILDGVFAEVPQGEAQQGLVHIT
jgi:hypothetical protein